ncbi:MAG: twin-arginine translocation signal domain-containing protein [Chitinophagaceae bacterium]|nr:twin-arginine translocation signal domain-containing protein [Chitinophagaceae bacterium]
MKQEEVNDKGRRDFLKTAALATVAATACGSLACSCNSKKAPVSDKVKLLSPTGEIVEIDSFLPVKNGITALKKRSG